MNIILRMNYLNSGGHAALSVLNRWLSPWQLKQFRVCVWVCGATGNQWRASTPELALCGPEEGCGCWLLPQLINRSVVWSVNCQDMSKEMSVSVSKKTSSKVLFCPQHKEKTKYSRLGQNQRVQTLSITCYQCLVSIKGCLVPQILLEIVTEQSVWVQTVSVSTVVCQRSISLNGDLLSVNCGETLSESLHFVHDFRPCRPRPARSSSTFV